MRWIAGTLAVVLALALGGYIALELMYPAYTHRYRLTIEVNVDGQIRSGSRVYEVTSRRQPQITAETGARIRVRGEAVFVDLGRGRNLVGLIASGPRGANYDSHNYIAIKAFGKLGRNGGSKAMVDVTGRRMLSDDLFPTLASFNDPSHSASGRIVNPSKLQEIFGPGVAINEMRIEMTSDPPTLGVIAESLPFLKSLGGPSGRSLGKTYTEPVVQLTAAHFIRR